MLSLCLRETLARGSVVIGGINVHARFDERRGQVGSVPQDDIMHPDLTVWQSLWTPGDRQRLL